jgi:hypothetical protein
MDDKITGRVSVNEAVATVESFDDLVADAGRGTESIGVNDVRPPRLMLCQSGSPQRKPDNPQQIKGLNELDLFNSLSNEIYGRTVTFAVIASLGSHWVEFDKDLKVVDRDVPEGDPRTEWTENEAGERVKPVATHFYDYLIWLIEHNEICVFSFKSTQIKNAFKLNGLLKLPLKMEGKIIVNPPAWARMYQVETKMESDKGYSWGGYNLSTVGITPRETRLLLSEMANSYSKKNINIDREGDAVEIVENASSENTGGEVDPSDM